MIQQHMHEKILAKFPVRAEGEIRESLNDVKNDFCEETRIITGEFDAFNTDGVNIYFDMPDGVVLLKQVALDNVTLKPMSDVYGLNPSNISAQGWHNKGGELGIGNFSRSGVTAIGSVLEVRSFGVKLAADFTTDMSQVSEVPTKYHRALIAGVMREFAEDTEQYKMATYYDSVYAGFRRRAKKEANTRQDGTSSVVDAAQY